MKQSNFEKKQNEFWGINENQENKSEWWEEYWQDMPEFNQKDLTPYKTIYIHFRNEKDIENFSKLINQKITDLTKYIWYPKSKLEKPSNFVYIQEKENVF